MPQTRVRCGFSSPFHFSSANGYYYWVNTYIKTLSVAVAEGPAVFKHSPMSVGRAIFSRAHISQIKPTFPERTTWAFVTRMKPSVFPASDFTPAWCTVGQIAFGG